MNLAAWLDAEKGRTAALATHLGKTSSAISQWRANGVPVAHMKAVREFTAGAVTLEELIPEAAGLPAVVTGRTGDTHPAAVSERRSGSQRRETRTGHIDRRAGPQG